MYLNYMQHHSELYHASMHIYTTYRYTVSLHEHMSSWQATIHFKFIAWLYLIALYPQQIWHA